MLYHRSARKWYMTSDRRKRKIVSLPVEKVIALRLVAHSILFAANVYLLCVSLLYITSPAVGSESLVLIRTTCLRAIGLSIVLVLPVIVYDSIKFSRRITGPVMRFKNMLPLVGVEKLGHVGLRDKDYWQEFAVEFNAMLDRLEASRPARP